MTRTADRMIAREWVFPLGLDENRGFLADIAVHIDPRGEDHAPVVVADNVARYVHDRNAGVCLEDYPSLAPPWPMFWIEYPSSGRQRRGVWCEDMTTRMDSPLLDRLPEDGEHASQLAAQAKADAIGNGSDPDDVGWVLGLALMVEQDRHVWGPAGIVCLALSQHGKVLGNAWSVAPITAIWDRAKLALDDKSEPLGPDLPLPTIAEMEAMTHEERQAVVARADLQLGELQARAERLERHADNLRDSASALHSLVKINADTNSSEWLIRSLAPAMQTLAFMHCRNVELGETSPPVKVQAKRRRANRAPLVRYHTLHIDLPRRSSGGGGASPVGGKSLHIVAGHFAHYGECCADHPPRGLLFGRLQGVYWVPTHARGEAVIGETRTDYEVRHVPA